MVNEKDLKTFFESRGNWKDYEYGEDHGLYLLYYDPKFWNIKGYYSYKPMIRNIIDNRKMISDKGNVLPYLLNENKDLEYYIKVYDGVVNVYKIYQNPYLLEDMKKYFDNSYKLFTPVIGNISKNRIFDDFKTFEKYVNKLIKNNEKDWKKGIVKKKNFVKKTDAISKKTIESEEKWYLRDITKNLLLYDGKEFLHKDMRITTSNTKFDEDDFKNPKMHYYDNITDVSLEDYLGNGKNYKNVMKQIKNIFKIITQSMNGKCYEENKYCFITFKSQIYIQKDYRVFIWTIDDNINYFNEKETYLDILGGIMYHIIDPIFPPKNKVEKYKNFIDL